MGLFLDTNYIAERYKYKSGEINKYKLMIRIEPEREKSEGMDERERIEERK